jgi:DNA-binding MarR family transcriptional regulator
MTPRPERDTDFHRALAAARLARRWEEMLSDHARPGERATATLTQAAVLDLAAAGPVSMGEIAAGLRVSPAVVTGIVDRLERLGLIQRRYPRPGERDRRKTFLFITAAGKAQLERVLGMTDPEPD